MSSNYVPPIPGQPQKKKTPWWIWGLLGCGGLIVVVVIVVVAGGAYLWTKVPKTELGMVARVIEMTNPDVQVVSLDEARGIVTLKDKKTGKQVTVNLEDAKQGKISFTDGKESVTIGGQEGVIKVEGEKGSAVYGQAPQNLPSWLPAYPGATAQPGGMSSDMEGVKAGVVNFTTSDSVSKVIAFYKEKLGENGLQPGDEGEQPNEDFASLTARSEDEKKSVTVTATRTESQTTVGVSYEEKTR
ncbi:MAG: hypothetical protein EHM61_16860 [Acidobacteria bacterium]|nr:MAG: hypothetical protein EHM61_16860 [Acidobacteriota bacterium]